MRVDRTGHALLRQDCGPVIARVLPQAEHHECILHILQSLRTHFREVYGDDYPETRPEAVALKGGCMPFLKPGPGGRRRNDIRG